MKKNYTDSFKKLWRLLLTIMFLTLCCGFWANAQDCQPEDIICIDGRAMDWRLLDATPTNPTYIHEADPYEGLDDQFTTGASDELFALKAWTYSQVKNKNNLCNGAAVLIDTKLYFAGDRLTTEGDAMIGFWFFQEGTAPMGVGTPGDKGYFEPLPTIGDILVLANFVNGGRTAAVTVYGIESYNYDNGGNITSWNFIELTGTDAYAAQNNDQECLVPLGWHYPTATYPLNAFYEGYVDLADLELNNPELNLCFGSFMLETRSSASLTASLDDFVGGAFSTKPVIATEDGYVCEPGGEVTLCVVAPGEEELPSDLTYQWYYDAELTQPLTGEGNFGKEQCLTVEITEETTFWVVATNNIGCISETAMATGRLYPSPSCLIEGSLEVCPGGEFIYSAPADMESYLWTITGNATIVGADNLQTVTIETGENCEDFTLTLNITDANGCQSNCQLPVNVKDDQKPVLTNCPTESADLGCNPEPQEYSPSLVPDWTDNCGIKSAGVRAGTPVADAEGCGWSVTHVYYAIDYCDNEETCEQTLTWKVDTELPVISTLDQSGDLGCNPTVEAPTFTGLDNCDGVFEPEVSTLGPVEPEDACGLWEQTWTANYTDDCENEALPVSIKYTWKVDTEAPQPLEPLADITFECNVPIIVPEPIFMDNCDGEVPYDCEITGYPDADCATFEFPVGTTEICFTAIDECLNPTTICINITVKPCEEFCTYTQGFYGSQKGTACNLEESVRGEVFTAGLIAQGDLTIGYGSNKVVFKSTYPTDVAKIIQTILPGGKSSYALNGTCEVLSTIPDCMKSYLTKQKTINNQLFAQTLVLGLNMRIKDGFGDVPLEAGKWLVTQKKLYCMEESGGVEMVCTPVLTEVEPYEFVCNQLEIDPYWYYMLPEGVLCFMAENGYDLTIGGLFELANKALGGAETDMMCGEMKVTLDQIASAVDMINNAFDECRILVGNLDEKIMCPDQCPETRSAIAFGLDESELKVYPNPFTTIVNFEFVSAKDADARLEIYDMIGQKITTLLDRKVEKGVLNRIEFRPDVAPGMLIYRLTMDGKVTNGTMIFNKQ